MTRATKKGPQPPKTIYIGWQPGTEPWEEWGYTKREATLKSGVRGDKALEYRLVTPRAKKARNR